MSPRLYALGLLLPLSGGCTWVGEEDWDARLDPDGDGVMWPQDCDDDDYYVSLPPTWYRDSDGDGFGDIEAPVEACEAPTGYVFDPTDCDDGDPDAHPGSVWYRDQDSDGYGGSVQEEQCERPEGYTAASDDCDDDDPDAYPGAEETCDEQDDDCDDIIDEQVLPPFWYADSDGDGYGVEATAVQACDAPPNFSEESGDCDDGDADIYPGADELCDFVDNDCDGAEDEDDAVDAPTWYRDADIDGYGDPKSTTESCAQPSGYITNDLDCNDSDPRAYPGADELWYDGGDQDCLGGSDYDADADGFDHDGYGGDDCDDADPAVNPSATEVWYDGPDQDCDGLSDFDADADGYDSQEFLGEDCDDADASVSPSASEIWYDGADTNCDGASDYDADGDGYESDDYGGDDCDDADAAVAPGAEEIWYDGFDQDCDGASDYDADGDGDDGDAWGGADCDDGTAEVGPSQEEVCGDGLDNDCDGGAGDCFFSGDIDLADADARFDGASSNDYAGTSIAGADVNGDGYADVLVGAYGEDSGASNAGAVAVFLGPVTGTLGLDMADALLTGEVDNDYVGWSLAPAGDVNNDGIADLLVDAHGDDDGGTGAGAVYLVMGPITADLSLSGAWSKFIGEAAGDGAGDALGSGDLDGDGYSDLLIGAPDSSNATTNAGALYVIDGAGVAAGDTSLSDATTIWTGESSNHSAGYAAAGAGDVNGDGMEDAIVGAWGQSDAASYAGAAYLLYGPASAGGDLSGADAIRTGEAEYDYAGIAVAGAGDVDGDGYDDLLVGASAEDSGAEDAGATYLLSGPLTGTANLSGSTAKLLGAVEYGYAGVALDGAGDLDGDGNQDLLIGAWQDSTTDTGAGVAFVVLGPIAGTIDLSGADARLLGEASQDNAGAAVARAGDVDGNGYDDLLVGAANQDDAASNAGTAYLILGVGL